MQAGLSELRLVHESAPTPEHRDEGAHSLPQQPVSSSLGTVSSDLVTSTPQRDKQTTGGRQH